MEQDLELIDKLLRKRARALGDAMQCAGFDLDMAGAYLEKALNSAEQTRFESHLADCPACRQQMTEFMRAFGQTFDPIPEPVTELAPKPVEPEAEPAKETDGGFAGILGWLTASPWRWVMTLMLIVLMAGTSWFIVGHKNIEQIANNPNPTNPQNPPQQSGNQPENSGNPPVVAQNNTATPTPNPTPTGPDNRTQPNAPIAPKDQIAKQNNQLNNDSPKPGSDNVKIDLPPQLKPENSIGDVTADNRPKLEVPTPNNSQLPPPPPVEDNKGGTDLAQGTPDNKVKNPNIREPKGNLPGINGIGLAPTPPTKKVGSKTFKKVKGVWIDEEFEKKGKALPQVKLNVSSTEYQQMIKENNGLKAYAELGERVIVVYNGKVYELSRK